jgi:hypothetical protein
MGGLIVVVMTGRFGGQEKPSALSYGTDEVDRPDGDTDLSDKAASQVTPKDGDAASSEGI